MHYMMRLAAVVSVLSLGCFCQPHHPPVKIPCSGNPDVKKVYDFRCHYIKTEGSGVSRNDPLQIKWDYLNVDKGEVGISILGHFPSLRDYRVNLCRYENDTAATWNEAGNKSLLLYKAADKSVNYCRMNGFIQHSYRVVEETNDTNLSPCQEMQNITFSLVYTGVYKLEVIDIDPVYYSSPMHFTTNFNPESILRKSITVMSYHYVDLKRITHVVSNISVLQAFQLEFIMRHIDEKTGQGTQLANQIIYLKGSSLSCLRKTEEEKVCKLFENEDKIECDVRNATSGSYNLVVGVHNDVCREQETSVWKHKNYTCEYHGLSEKATKIMQYQPPASSYDSRVLFVMIGLVSVFISIVAGLGLYFKNRWRHKDDRVKLEAGEADATEDKPELLPDPPQIYLMYARDCLEFMHVMSTFRIMLKRNFEVYDCYDDECFEEIAQVGTSWPEKYITKNNVKVVLVESRCAKLHLQAHNENFKISYQYAQPWDNLFMYGLKVLLGNPKFNSYSKMFVVSIPGFTSECDELSALAPPFVRFSIPFATESLLSNVAQQYNVKLSADWTKDLSRLEEAISKLNIHTSNNMNYLDNMLVRSQVNGVRRLFSRLRV